LIIPNRGLQGFGVTNQLANIAWHTQFIELACVREDPEVKIGGLFGVVIEPEEMAQVYSWLACGPPLFYTCIATVLPVRPDKRRRVH
jgi:hypothetical protein